MIEATIESKFKTQISAACTTYPVSVVGFWDSASTGSVKVDEPPCIRLTTPPGSSTAQQNDKRYDVAFNCEILSKIDTDPTKAKLIYWAGQVQSLFQTLKNSGSTMEGNNYSVSGSYTINGIELPGGDMGFDTDSQCWYVNIPLIIHYCKA